MIDIMKRFFGKGVKKVTTEKEPDRVHDLRVATCALFLEMANVDGEFSGTETDQIIAILKRDYGLPTDHVEALIRASQDALKGSIDLWQFTNRINQNYTTEEKLGIIEMVWRVAYADGKLDKHEDYLVHKLAKLLRLNHKQLIDAKMLVLEEIRGQAAR